MNKQIIETEDGSLSFYNEDFNEAYHSRIGAYTEALHKHVLACQIPELAKSLSTSDSAVIRILDVCFGLAYNSAVAIDQIWQINPNIQVEIIGLESDREIIEAIEKISWAELKSPELKKALAELSDHPETIITQDNLRIEIYLDDARTSIQKLEDDFFDAVFFDPFSPKTCPELWQPDFIQTVVNKAKAKAWLSTYSSSRLAKDGFSNAGCQLFAGPSIGRRSGGVLAQKF